MIIGNKEIKILAFRPFVYTDNGPGNNRMRAFIRELAASGFRVTCFALVPPECDVQSIIEDEKRYGINVILCNSPFSADKMTFREYLERWVGVRLLPVFQNTFTENFVTRHKLKKFLQKERFDCLFTSYVPMGALHIAAKLSKKFNTPWIADLRDIPDELDTSREKRLTRLHARVLEKVCKTAKAILTVSPPLVDGLKERYNLPGSHVIYNGFDDDQFFRPDRFDKANQFRISYCGSLGAGRNPDLLFAGLDLLLGRDVDLSDVTVSFYGKSHSQKLHGISKDWESLSLVRFEGMLPREEIFDVYRKSGLLLSLSSPGFQGILTSKIFEYAASFRPILSVPPDHDALDDFIQRAKIGRSCGSAEEVANFIHSNLLHWRETGKLPQTKPDVQFLAQFSRKAQAGILAKIILDNVVNRNA